MYEGVVADGNLTFTGPARFTLIENSDGTVTNDWELRDDNGRWMPWRRTIMRRIPTATEVTTLFPLLRG